METIGDLLVLVKIPIEAYTPDKKECYVTSEIIALNRRIVDEVEVAQCFRDFLEAFKLPKAPSGFTNNIVKLQIRNVLNPSLATFCHDDVVENPSRACHTNFGNLFVDMTGDIRGSILHYCFFFTDGKEKPTLVPLNSDEYLSHVYSKKKDRSFIVDELNQMVRTLPLVEADTLWMTFPDMFEVETK